MPTNPDNARQQNNRASYSQNLTLLAGLTSDQQQQQQLACEQGQHRSEPVQRAQSQSIKTQNQLQLVEPSPTHLLSRPEEPQQPQPKHKRDKKKSRGDRKGQHYRAKLRKRRLNDQQIANLEQNYKNMKHSINIQSSTIPEIDIVAIVPTHTQTDIPENQHALQRKSIKLKRETRPVGITTSLSQMSITNLPKKRPRSTSMARITEEKNLEETESNTKPKYLKVPDQVFKNILSKSLADGKSIVETLDTPEKLEFILPDDRSIILRYIIETLFIIYTETKLNMICPIGGNAEQRYGRPYDLIWCANLNHSSM
ncbi:unnamed protein product [Rotaria sordida]|uniref:Uncharacterized protein n=1 Tax=Rotaria sordida TaxID=392033 RepID=A0A815IDD3_9BILA|nr:unnamed protein product [Rotaria sordida]